MTKVIEIFKADTTTKQPLPLYLSRINAGLPSPAEDYLDKKLDLNERLIKHPLLIVHSNQKINVFFLAENPKYSPIEIKDNMDFEVWGMVVHVIYSV